MTFHSILFGAEPEDRSTGDADWSETFSDLRLDQIFERVAAGHDEYDLQPFFREPLQDVAAITARHEVFRDLEQQQVRNAVAAFAHRMRLVRQNLAQCDRLHYPYQRARWFLDAAGLYCSAVNALCAALDNPDGDGAMSAWMRGFQQYLSAYAGEEPFLELADSALRVRQLLSEIVYKVHTRGNRVTVTRYEGEPDYSTEVDATFQRFRQGAVEDYRVAFSDPVDMNHVEAQILALVARLYPDRFQALMEFEERHRDFLDATVTRFDREIQFYLAYLDFIGRMREPGLDFCYPVVSEDSRAVRAEGAFDLALAASLNETGSSVVTNDFALDGAERIFVVTGPNQGGKTTFARLFGQIHYLASLGLPVPGHEAHLLRTDRIFTHFAREEHGEDLRGRLMDEMLRVHDILQRATSRSVVIMNESFSSTSLQDARFLGEEVLMRLVRRNVLGVYVTFVDELSRLGEGIVSMVAGVDVGDNVRCTYRIARKAADGNAYALALAEKFGLTYEALRGRLAR